MNLREIVSSAINSINPLQEITIVPSGDFITNEYGEQIRQEGNSFNVLADVQPVKSEDLRFINNYTQTSEYKAFWVSSEVNGTNRLKMKMVIR